MSEFTTAAYALFNTFFSATVVYQTLLMCPVVCLLAFVYYLFFFRNSNPAAPQNVELPLFSAHHEEYFEAYDTWMRVAAYILYYPRTLRKWSWNEESVFSYSTSIFSRRFVPLKTDCKKGYAFLARNKYCILPPYAIDADRKRSVKFAEAATRSFFIVDSPVCGAANHKNHAAPESILRLPI